MKKLLLLKNPPTPMSPSGEMTVTATVLSSFDFEVSVLNGLDLP